MTRLIWRLGRDAAAQRAYCRELVFLQVIDDLTTSMATSEMPAAELYLSVQDALDTTYADGITNTDWLAATLQQVRRAHDWG